MYEWQKQIQIFVDEIDKCIKNYNDEPQKVCCIILNGSAFPCPCGYNPNKKIMVLTYTMILFQSYIIFIPFSHHQLIKIHKIRRLIK